MQDNSYEEIIRDGKLIAIILRSNYSNNETTFFNPPDFSQQLGYIVYKRDGIIKPHFHKKIHRDITLTQEVLYVKKGRLTVNFYTTQKKYIESRELRRGDVIFLCSGGHGFKMLEDTEMVEVKQGPYSGKNNDKVVFRGVEDDSCL